MCFVRICMGQCCKVTFKYRSHFLESSHIPLFPLKATIIPGIYKTYKKKVVNDNNNFAGYGLEKNVEKKPGLKVESYH